MDILDHSLDTSGENEEVLGIDSKAILAQDLTIVEEGSLGSGGEEQSAVDHLSPQLLESNNDSEVQYSFRSPDGTVTYRVLQVEEGMETLPQFVSSSAISNTGVQQVLTGQLNGQLYVIGNANEVFNNQSQRTIAPRSIEHTTTSTIKKVHRDERRRATHNEVERRRRDKINNWILKLSKIIPDLNSESGKGSGTFEGQSKGGILAKACEYIMELRQSNTKLAECIKDNEQMVSVIEDLRKENEKLKRDNNILKTQITQHGIELPKMLSNNSSL